ACSRVELTVNGYPVGRARLGDIRPDVEALFGMPAAALAGFHHFVDLTDLPELGDEAEFGGFAVGLDGTRFALPAARVRVEPVQPELEVESSAGTNAPTIRRQRLSGAGARGELELFVCTHELGYGGAQLFLAELLRRIAQLGR